MSGENNSKWKKVLAGVGGLLVLGGMGYYAMHHGGEKNSNNGSSSGSITDVISGGGNSNYFADDPEFPYDWERYLEEHKNDGFNLKYFPKKYREELNESLMKLNEVDPLKDLGYTNALGYYAYINLLLDFYAHNFNEDKIPEYLESLNKLDDIVLKEKEKIIFDGSTLLYLPSDFKGDPKLDRKKFDERRKKIRRAYLEMVRDAEECVVDYYNRHPEEWGKDSSIPKDVGELEEEYVLRSEIILGDKNKTIPEIMEYSVWDYKNINRTNSVGGIEKNMIVFLKGKNILCIFSQNCDEDDIIETSSSDVSKWADEGIESCKETEEDIEELKKYSCDVNEEECEKRIVESFRRSGRGVADLLNEKKDMDIDNIISFLYLTNFRELYSHSWDDLKR